MATLLEQVRAILSQRGLVPQPGDYVIQDDGSGPYLAKWNSDRLGVPPTPAELALVTEAQVAAAKQAQLDAQATAAFDPSQPGFQQEHVRMMLAAVLKVTHQRLQTVAQAAGLPATTVGTFAAYVADVRADFRGRLT